MLTAITRRVGPRLGECELLYLLRQRIDVEKAALQHQAYEAQLQALGAKVISLPPEPDLPDSIFVEDPAVVVDEVAVITRMGVASRRPEAKSLARALAPFRPLREIEEPATLEGGDIVRDGRNIFVGMSARTNKEGLRQLRDILEPLGYSVQPVAVRGCMHLKSGCCYLGHGTLLANRGWIDAEAFAGYRIIDVAEDWAADVLPIGETILMADRFPGTAARVGAAGWKVQTLDVSELMKAEAGLTCMSLIFE